MIEEAYVSEKLAILLKDCGFSEKTIGYYGSNGNGALLFSMFVSPRTVEGCGSEIYSAPTHQMVMRWLREVYKIQISVSLYSQIIGNEETHSWNAAVIDLKSFDLMNKLEDLKFETYEDGCEYWIEWVLRNYILKK